jgi:alpha-glucosidase
MPWQGDATDLGFGSAPARSWLPVAESHRALAVDRQEADAGSLLQLYRTLLHWRRGHSALVHGDMTLLPADPQVLGYIRAHTGERVLCAFNLSDTAARLALPAGMPVIEVLQGSGVDGADCAKHGGRDVVRFAPWGVLFARLG